MSEKRKKFWIRIIVALMIAAFVLPSFIVFFSRCAYSPDLGFDPGAGIYE